MYFMTVLLNGTEVLQGKIEYSGRTKLQFAPFIILKRGYKQIT